MDSELMQYLDTKFGALDARFDGVHARFNAVDVRFDAIDAKFDAVDAKFDAVDAKFDAMDAKFVAIDTQFGELEARIMERVGGRIDAVEERLKDYIRAADHDLETKIIGEFHKWGRTSDMRTRQAITDTGLLGERMLAVEDRVSALERERRA